MPQTDFNYELLFELSPDLLCIAGFDGYFKKINPAVSRLLEYSMEELYSRPINDFVYEEDKDITAHVRSELTQYKPLLNFENRYVTKAGKIVWLSWTSDPVPSERLIFAIAKNITHKKRLEEERDLLLTNLIKVNDDMKQRSYTTSHDLRSPVNNLLGVFNLIELEKIEDEETRHMLRLVKGASENLHHTLNNYIDLLSGEDQAVLEEVDLKTCINKVLASITSLIESSRATIHLDFQLKTIKSSSIYMESIFLNLITNAIKYSKQGVDPEIRISSYKNDDRCLLTITDNGLGLDMDKFGNRIFGLGQRFHHHSDSKGIGLYLVYIHVKSLGGNIEVESRVNEGTKFIIRFPE